MYPNNILVRCLLPKNVILIVIFKCNHFILIINTVLSNKFNSVLKKFTIGHTLLKLNKLHKNFVTTNY